MTESPFLPRERLFKQQQYFQSLSKHTHLKGRYDAITSVGIPLALAASSLFMIVCLELCLFMINDCNCFFCSLVSV
uniref:Uncharacterized protein n=1 Tax=Triticum urartu TaxID=4572 RepID=A0A8R7QPN0_TRIUA